MKKEEKSSISNFEEKFNEIKRNFYKTRDLTLFNEKSCSTERKSPLIIDSPEQNEECHSADSHFFKKTKSKFFLDSQKKSKTNEKKLQKSQKLKNSSIPPKNPKKWDSTVKLIPPIKNHKNPLKLNKSDKNFIYLNVLQKSFKSMNIKKNNFPKPTSSSIEGTHYSNKMDTIPDILECGLFQNLNENKNLKELLNLKKDSICLNNLAIEENKNEKIDDDIKDFSPLEVHLASSSNITKVDMNIEDHQGNQRKTSNKNKDKNLDFRDFISKNHQNSKEKKNNNTSIDKLEENLQKNNNMSPEEREKKELEERLNYEKILQENQRKFESSQKSRNTVESSLDDNSIIDDNNANNSINTLNESCDRRDRKISKSAIKKMFDRKNKNKSGTQILENSLNNMYIEKLVKDTRSNSRGEHHKPEIKVNPPVEDNKDGKKNEFILNRKELGNSFKINIIDFDAKQELDKNLEINHDDDKKKCLCDEDYLDFLDKEIKN